MAEAVGELAELLTKRRRFVRLFLEGQKHKGDLETELSLARSTVDRAVRELEVAGLVEREGDGYALTTVGRLIASRYREFEVALEDIETAEPVVSALPRDTVVESALLEGADVTRSEVHAPDRVVRETTEMVGRGLRIRGFSPASHEAYVETFHERIVEHGMETELVFTTDVLEELTGTHAERFMAAVETGQVRVFQIDALPPIGLIVVDENEAGEGEVGVVVYTPDGGIRGFCRNDTAAAMNWADRTYRTYRERATEIEL